MSNVIILGAQWGDEGKGKLVDLLCEHFDFVVRYQGGHNAGHTILIGDRKFVLRLVPSGILHPGKTAVIGNGLVVDPIALLEEIGQLAAAGVDVTGQLRVSNRAHVLLPSHRLVEKITEANPGKIAIGTTSRGIGPGYEDKAGRWGIRIADLLDREYFGVAAASLMADHKALAGAFGIEDGIDCKAIIEQYAEAAERIRPLVCDTSRLLSSAIASGKNLLFEGAQGTMLDLDHGTYPFVTSSSASAGGACTGTGVPPTKIDGVIGISKAYITRVGGGPFPTEAFGEAGDLIRKRGNEFGAVTGRPRRCGWFDAPLIRYTAAINGFDSMVLTKLDVLDSLDEIPVCVAYTIDGVRTNEMPATSRALAKISPIYTTLPGWKSSTKGISDWKELPTAARAYIDFIEAESGVEAGCISTGPERNETIRRVGSRFQSLTT
ncbi:MAG TPA: adenylosuccinate synthase [Bryobacteraceae bacterium]|jgi:adenylosuccinate synthase|nr:adenylosuccinate synthase [Bryobacteraceae bacterium]